MKSCKIQKHIRTFLLKNTTVRDEVNTKSPTVTNF